MLLQFFFCFLPKIPKVSFPRMAAKDSTWMSTQCAFYTSEDDIWHHKQYVQRMAMHTTSIYCIYNMPRGTHTTCHCSYAWCDVDPDIHHAGATVQQSICRCDVGIGHNIGRWQMLKCISHQKLTFENIAEPIGQDEKGIWDSFRLWDGTTDGC